MIEKIQSLQAEFDAALTAASALEKVKELRVVFLGRNGSVTALMKELRNVPPETKAVVGKEINQLKKNIEKKIEKKLTNFQISSGASSSEEVFDSTLPGRREISGSIHPVIQMMDEIIEVFNGLGFSVEEGPEIESEYYNFEALNIPKDHPARDMQDTFYIDDSTVLRTHTSPVQIHVMEKQQPPLRIIAPGRVYRCDSDISHTPMFHQIEGLMVDKGVSFSNLKGIMEIFLHRIFGENTDLRFRPSFFPFTCPSAEVDIQCVICKGKGCRVCSNTGWIEILGAGMVDPTVFKFVDYDLEKWTGFAFGLGIERIAMLRFGISDIRLFFDNDLRFLKQF